MSQVEGGRAASLTDRRVTVMGLGLFGGGVGAARWAMAQGARVTVTDMKGRQELEEAAADLEGVDARHPVRLSLGGHTPEDFERAEVLIVNPAVPPTSPWIAEARASGARVTTAIALLLERCPARVVAVTGTQGKSSTSTFIHGLLERVLDPPARCLLGGNIGGSLLGKLDGLTADDVLVLELSSYQLEHLPPDLGEAVDVAAITNIGVDHLERHGTLANYREAKLRLVDLVRPGGLAVVPEGELAELVRGRTGVRVLSHGAGGDLSLQGSEVVRAVGGVARPVADAASLDVPGAFQRHNLVVALAAAAEVVPDPPALAAAIPDLPGLAHRMESVGRLRRGGAEIHVVDNGVSTTPDSTLAAIEAIDGAGPNVLVAGGKAKLGADLEALARRLAGPGGWALVPFGAAGGALAEAARRVGVPVDDEPLAASAEAAAVRALALAERSGAGTLLFSPACASFDGYANFKERALAFRGALFPAADGASAR